MSIYDSRLDSLSICILYSFLVLDHSSWPWPGSLDSVLGLLGLGLGSPVLGLLQTFLSLEVQVLVNIAACYSFEDQQFTVSQPIYVP